MNTRYRSIALLLALAGPAHAGGVLVPGVLGSLEVQVDSLRDVRFHTVVPQKYDFSCGSAALATLLNYHYGRPTTETTTFDGMFKVGDQDLIRAQGFSLLDMKHYLEEHEGLSSDGFRIGLTDLERLGVPAIAMVETRGYRHFVVVKGIAGGQVLVGDPSLGLRAYAGPAFTDIWVNGILFIIRDELDRGQRQFNATESWSAVGRSPDHLAVNRDSLGSFTLNLPRAMDW